MKKKKLQKNWFEWLVFGVGLLLVVSTLSYLAYDAATLGDAPPSIEVRKATLQRPLTIVPSRSSITETRRRKGLVKSHLERRRGEGAREFTVPFLPRRSTREGG